MNASKEMCQLAIDAIGRVGENVGAEVPEEKALKPVIVEDVLAVRMFLQSALKRLPKQESYEADARRHRQKQPA